MAGFNPNQANDLIGKYLDQYVSEADVMELVDSLIADRQMADELARACRLELMLEQHFAEPSAEIQLPKAIQAATSRIAVARRVAVTVSTMAVLVVLGAFIWRGSIGREQPPTASHVLSGQVVVHGVVTSAVPLDAPFEVRGSRSAELSLADGADALLEPTTTAVFHRSGTSPLLRLTSGGGRFRAATGEPIQIQTPAGTIRSRDAQFDINLEETFVSGEPSMPPQALMLVTVAVLTGQVEVQDETQKVPVAAGQQRAFSPQKVPKFAGEVIEVSSDGTRLTIEGARPKPNAPPSRRTVEIRAATDLAFYGVPRGGDKPTVGYRAVVTLDANAPQQAVRIEFGDPRPTVNGTVVAVTEDMRSMTVEIFRKGDEPLRREFQLTDDTRVEYRDVDSDGKRPTIGYRVEIWTEGDSNQAIDARFRHVRKEPLSRSFATPSIANVTHLATTNVGVKNLIIEGSEPLTVTETFGFVAEDCHFINDTSIGGKNVVDFNMNTLNGCRFSRNRFTSIGPGRIVLEMTQRNSRHGVWEDNTIEMMQGGMGEYAADIQFLNNTFTIHPNDRTSVGLMIGGKDIVFRGNKVTCGAITGGEGWGCVLADCVGPGYDRYVGNITISDNTFTYHGDGNQLTHLVAGDTTFTGNKVTVTGSAIGVRGEGPPPQALTITNNKFCMGTGAAVMIASHDIDGSTVTGNAITGSGAHGIYVASPEKPNDGRHVIHGNKVNGFREELFIDLKLHPGTVLTPSE